jgi:zinc and cadmium transporter
MSGLLLVIIVGIISALLSLSVALILVSKDSWAKYLAIWGTPFAAGILLMAVRDLIPHAINEGISASNVITATIVGIIIFFLLEKISGGFHHHHEEDTEIEPSNKNKTQGWIFLIGDAFHNFIDGVSIGGAFLISPVTGFITAIAISAHDLPQEVGEFGVQIRSGFTKKQTLIRNIVASFTTIIGAIITYQFGGSLDLPIGYIYGGVAGFLLYIALSDIIPSIHRTEKTILGFQTIMLFLGILIGATVGTLGHKYIDSNHPNHEQHDSKIHQIENTYLYF